MKQVIHFEDIYLERRKSLTTEQYLIFLEAFQKMQTEPTHAITIPKIPEPQWLSLSKTPLRNKSISFKPYPVIASTQLCLE